MGNKQFWNKERIFAIGMIVGIICGIMIGMVVQQMIMINGIEKAGEAWEGVISEMNLEIDINETKLVEATYKVFGLEELNVSENKTNGK